MEHDRIPLNIRIKQKFQAHANWRLSVRFKRAFALNAHTDKNCPQGFPSLLGVVISSKNRPAGRPRISESYIIERARETADAVIF